MILLMKEPAIFFYTTWLHTLILSLPQMGRLHLVKSRYENINLESCAIDVQSKDSL